MFRSSFTLIAVAAALLAPTTDALAIPQQTVTKAQGGGASRISVRCSSCASQPDSARREQAKLLMRIDSLRWEIENRRLSDVERERASTELNLTVRSLQRSLNESAMIPGAYPTPMARRVDVVNVPRGVFRTRGYLGVTFDGPSAELDEPGNYVIRFFKYPRIALVEPSSPAERAGVQQGDTLLALNSTDVVRNEISLSKLLVPDSTVVMRVRREGNTKDLKVIVAVTPDYLVRRREVPFAYGGGGGRVSAGPVTRAPVAPVPGDVRVYEVPVPQAAPVSPEPARIWIDYEGIAGARVETVTEGLAKALKVEQGVLVVRTRPGTVAYRSGLREGDVIIRAAGRPVTGVPMLRSLLAAGDGEEGVRVVIVREQKQKDVTLRW